MIDKYVVCVMIFSIMVIVFRSGMIWQKRETLSKNKKIFEIVLLIPYISAVVGGFLLFFFKEVVV